MKIGNLADQNIALLKKVLDLRADREKVIASNIANSETPGYSPSRLHFEDQLKQAVNQQGFAAQTTHASHIPITGDNLSNVQGVITTQPDTTGIGDRNSVSLDEEMLALSQNELLYETAAQLLKKKLSLKKYVISGGQ